MSDLSLDLNLLAEHLESKMRADDLSVRAAARLIGCGAATLTRMLKGSDSEVIPDGINLIRATSWLGKGLAYFEINRSGQQSTLADVETHLRGLRDLPEDARDGLVAMVRAVYDQRRLR